MDETANIINNTKSDTNSNSVTNIGSEKNITDNRTIIVDPLQEKLLEPTWVSLWKEVLAFVFAFSILYDFVIAPAFVQIADAFFKANIPVWIPLTTQGGGLFYISMGAILGVSSWGDMVKTKALIQNMPDHS